MCVLVFERVAIVYLLVNVNTFVCGRAKNCISTHYSMELHGPICLSMFLNMDVFTLLPGALCVGVFILKRSMSTKHWDDTNKTLPLILL